ncbi:DUF1003 domain-containing protein [Devosia nitrariae]|uniref:Membrane protein n=1 Tax=Devosia nitrariae TaxID=2071872 RepID=A0ABQ5W343_9HYPH|nr:DUF1003 domain-containing protein [Devosia nitrariae]GLQ54273.1 membrane protein [Devosia nitrariae]
MEKESRAPQASVLERNIEALLDRRRREVEEQGWQERLAITISSFAGSMTFVYLHLVVLISWIAINLRWIPVVPAWDPTFVVLAMVASVEALFLTAFILISQNRLARLSDRRADLDVQIGLLNERETTRLLELVSAIAERLEVPVRDDDRELSELRREVEPEAVIDEIEAAEARGERGQ